MESSCLERISLSSAGSEHGQTMAEYAVVLGVITVSHRQTFAGLSGTTARPSARSPPRLNSELRCEAAESSARELTKTAMAYPVVVGVITPSPVGAFDRFRGRSSAAPIDAVRVWAQSNHGELHSYAGDDKAPRKGDAGAIQV